MLDHTAATRMPERIALTEPCVGCGYGYGYEVMDLSKDDIGQRPAVIKCCRCRRVLERRVQFEIEDQ
jgi:hypothetical protein